MGHPMQQSSTRGTLQSRERVCPCPRGGGHMTGSAAYVPLGHSGGVDRRSVLGRALVVLDAFGPGELTLPVAELVRRVGLPKSTVHRLVADLVAHGLLERAGTEVCLAVHP